MSETQTDQPTLTEDRHDTVECAGPCGREVYEGASVDVVAGALKGYVGDEAMVVGTDAGRPEVVQWCRPCADYEFGVTKSARERRKEKVDYYVTAKTVTAFVLGAMLMLLAASVMII